MKRMEFSHVTSVFLITMAMTLAVSCALPYQTLFDPDTAELADSVVERNPASPAEYGNEELDRLRRLVALKLMRRELISDDAQNNKDSRIAKRLDFGFAGLDNIDHIITTLDRKEAMKSMEKPRLLQNMQRHGFQGMSVAQLTKMMKNAG